GLSSRHAGGNELGHRLEPGPIRNAASLRRGKGERDLALWSALETLGDDLRAASDNLLERLRELATNGDGPLRERCRQGRERRGQPLRRLERDGGVRPGRKLFPERRKRAVSPGQVPEKLVALEPEAARDEGRLDSRRAREHRHRETSVARC